VQDTGGEYYIDLDLGATRHTNELSQMAS
jgi:hypothetical protein